MFILDQTSVCGTVKTLESSYTSLAKTLPFVHSLRQRGIAGILTGAANIDQIHSLTGTYLSGLSSQFFQSGLTGNSARALGYNTDAL